MKNTVPVSYSVERETEKAVYCCVQMGYARNTTKYLWIPKSVCELETYVATYNALNEPETYGVRVVGVAGWFAVKNKLQR